MNNLWKFEVLWSEDEAKRDPELVCAGCSEVLCDVEHGDTLDALARTATDHQCKAA